MARGEMPRAGTREGDWGLHVLSRHSPLSIATKMSTILFCVLEGRPSSRVHRPFVGSVVFSLSLLKAQ